MQQSFVSLEYSYCEFAAARNNKPPLWLTHPLEDANRRPSFEDSDGVIFRLRLFYLTRRSRENVDARFSGRPF